MWIFVPLLAWPLLEIGLFILVGGWIGLWPTLAVVILTGMLGMSLMRWQGMGVLREAQTAGVSPVSPIAHGALILLGGFLLILPGFFTDVLGILLMVPVVRRFLIARFGAQIEVRGFSGRGFSRSAAEDWVDAEYEEVVPDRDKIGGSQNAGPSRWSKD